MDGNDDDENDDKNDEDGQLCSRNFGAFQAPIEDAVSGDKRRQSDDKRCAEGTQERYGR